MELFFLLIWLDLSLSMIVLPFKTVYVNKNGQIDKNSKEYNSTHFMNDYFNASLYTTIKIGNPSQEMKVMLTYQDCGFIIGQDKKCANDAQYLSQYNSHKSTDFSYTDLYTIPVGYEFDEGCSAVDSMYLYKDLNKKNYENIKKVDFYLGSDTNAPICAIIGFKMDQSDSYCRNLSFINNLKARKTIDNYNWIIKYESNNEGSIIIGANMKDVIPNFNEQYAYRVYSRLIGGTYPWSFNIDEMIVGNKDASFTGNDRWIEIDNDFSFLVGNNEYNKYIHEKYFNDLIAQNICTETEWYHEYNRYYNIIECDKEKIKKEFIDNFPSISFINKDLTAPIIFEGKELFTETKYKYFFNVMFAKYGAGLWIFGKLFLKKYFVMINLNQKLIEIYINKEESNMEKSSTSLKTFLMIFGVIVLLCITGVLSYILGKKLNQIRKKSANELDDEYEYIQKNIVNDN